MPSSSRPCSEWKAAGEETAEDGPVGFQTMPTEGDHSKSTQQGPQNPWYQANKYQAAPSKALHFVSSAPTSAAATALMLVSLLQHGFASFIQ